MALVLPKSIFIHVPKCAGGYVREVARKLGLKSFETGNPDRTRAQMIHTSILAVAPELRKGRIAFGFVRHPCDWLRSRWAYTEQQKAKTGAGMWCTKLWHKDFSIFVDRVLATCPAIPSSEMFKRLGFVKEDGRWIQGPQTTEFVGRVEDLPGVLCDIWNLAGEDFDRDVVMQHPHVRVAGNLPAYRERGVYTESQKARLLEANADLCEMFGYE